MKFNFLTKQKTKNSNSVANHQNATAFALTPEYELYAAVVTTSLSTSFYEKDTERLERIRSLIKKCNPEFVAKLAVYARNDMYMRSIPLVLVVELAKIYSGDALVSKMIVNVIQRADEITELLAYYQAANKRTGAKKLNRLSKQVQKGLAASFNRFDEYQLAKYNKNTAVSLKDALFLVHPKAKDAAQQVVFDKIASKSLAVPYTWETELSQLGQTRFATVVAKEKALAQKWEELIDSNKIGYMALMRNLRNILEAGVSSTHILKVCDYLTNETAVKNSKQLPFRFLAAYREIKVLDVDYVSYVLDALEKAVLLSSQNIKGFDMDTSVVIACDVSGSMQQPIAPKSKVLLYDIGLMLGMLLQNRCDNAVSGMFGDKWKIINMSKRSVLANVEEFYKREGEVGYSTNGYLVIEDLIRRGKVVDKVMMFTDVQLWNSNNIFQTFQDSWSRYKRIAPNARLYLFDLAGYGHAPVSMERNDVYLIAGWSDKVFDVLGALENKTSAIQYINRISLM
ncbi:TROVE domain-containing protein [Flavobacterium sp. 25HG05S-40]|uniref:TROVE domain-containing protein n=1 Tax=Flavobacterium sp. 25HG05S-40 TaxID=3458682 RepID=UPI00404419EE